MVHYKVAKGIRGRVFGMTFMQSLNCTVETFNSFTSRPNVCQCLVVQKPVDNMSKRYAKYINDPRSLRIKATFSCEVIRGIHTQKNGLQSGVRLCIMTGLAAHLVQELNVGTVPIVRPMVEV